MPLTPQEYLEWWLTTGLGPLKELADKETLGCSPQQVGFEQTIQRRLRNFDNDVDLREALRLHVERISSHQTSDPSYNPRNKLRELTSTAFKKPEDGGIDPVSALEGLCELNAVELRRRRLVAETPLTFKPNHPAYGSAAMVQELNRKATEKFGQFYMGFRASMVIEELKQAKATRKPSVEIMAVVNALFPAHDLLKDSEDVSLVPYTEALLYCIRFTILYHLLGDNPSSDKQQALIQEKLFIWCSLPKYQQAYKAFAQYIEEFKTIETLCFSVLQLAQSRSSRRKSGSRRPSVTPNSAVMIKSILKGSPQSPREYDAGGETVIKGEKVGVKFLDPGRKLKKKPLPMKNGVKKKKKKNDIPPVPPTPDIPESMRSTITRTGLKFLQRMRSQPEIQSDASSSSKVPQIATASAGNKARSSTKLVKQPVRHRASQGQVRDSFYLRTSSLPEASIRNSQQGLHGQRSSYAQSSENASTMGRQELNSAQGEGSSSLRKPEVTYSMCQPRLSAMEYTRLYLVEEANAKKEKRLCELPPPKKVWLWGPRWEEFLVLPKIPSTIKRRFSLNLSDEERKSMALEPLGGGHDSDADSIETVKGTTSVPAKPPRLSLNLESMAATLTSLMNLASLGSDKGPHSPSKAQLLEVVEASGKGSLFQGHVAAEDMNQTCGSTAENIQSLSPTSSVSSVSIDHDEEEDLYSDDRHLWPSPMSQRNVRLASASPTAAEASEIVPDDSQSIENTTPQLSDDTFETSSIYSDDSAKTAVFVGDDNKGIGNAPQTPEIARRPEQLATPEEASPARAGLPCSYSCASFNSLSSDRSPLTHFPISAEQRSRATTEDIVQGIITQSGGRLRVEDARQVQLVESKHYGEIQASSADIWHADEYMEPDLQPAPLNLSKKPSVAGPSYVRPEIPARAVPAPNALDRIQPIRYNAPKSGKSEVDTPEKYHEKIKSYESGFVPLPGSLLYEADKNTDIIRIPRSLSSSSKSSSSVSAIITPSKPGPAKETEDWAKRAEKAANDPKPYRSMNDLYGVSCATPTSGVYPPQPGKPSPTLSDLDEFFGVGPYEQAFLEKHPEAAKPFVLPPKVVESPEAPVFTDPTYATPVLRRRDMSIQQHRAIPQNTAQRVMDRKPKTPINTSSFALHRAQGNKATILPMIEGRSRAKSANTKEHEAGIGQHGDYEDSISEEHIPQHTFLDDVHRFSLQRYDISARHPSAHARSSTYFEKPSPAPPAENAVAEGRKATNVPATTLASLFRKRNRNRTVNQQQALNIQQVPRAQQAPITPTGLLPPPPAPPAQQPLTHWEPFSEQQEQSSSSSSSRISGDSENLSGKQQRIRYFREQAARALTGEVDLPGLYGREGDGASRVTIGSEDGRNEDAQRKMKTSASEGRAPGRQISKPITGIMDSWMNQGLPSPAPTTPLPPVPHRPSGRQISGMRSTPRPSAAATSATAASAGASTGLLTGAGRATAQPGAGGQAPSQRGRNPLGLRVETTAWKLRKASKEVLRSGRNVSSPHAGGSNGHGQK
ncbi:hypothetical protein Trco_004932 [Trichoderma cornu-damae]|uniref:Uncharacterized protein n=1 Tax=Trichoderma cornu-damae TaxID=654480 RepID=A0A9P8TUR1_9HYPO|nr:hypothetical protein Trco_004932 [Trichoderma cornu-damae]